MKKTFFLVLILTALVLVAGACSAKPAAPASQAAQATQAPEPTAAPSPEPTAVKAAPATDAPKPAVAPKPAETRAAPAPTEETLALSDRESGLDKLKSYRMSWRGEWSSVSDGKPISTTWSMQEEYTTSPEPAVHWIYGGSDSKTPADVQAVEMWKVGQTTYMVTRDDQGEAQCTQISSEDQQGQAINSLVSPNMLGSLSGAKYVGAETVNGVKTKHYKYDQNAIGKTALSNAAGEVWVAVDGGYVVKEIVTWSGGSLLAATTDESQGSGRWEWEVKDANQPITITPPTGCESGAAGLPIMKDATDKSTFGDMISYKSASKPADVADFYEKEMPAAGWQVLGETQEMGEVTMLNYEKDGQSVSIMIMSDKGTTQVIITATK